MTTTTPEIIATALFVRDMPDRYRLEARFELVQFAGNKRPHFSITADLLNLRRRGDNRYEACGQLVDDIKEWLPALTPYLPIHLADDDGTPMHAVENGAYWLGLGDPRYLPDDAPRFDIFANLWRLNDQEAREHYAYANNDPHPTEALRFLAKGEAARWQAEADDALAFIRSHADAHAS